MPPVMESLHRGAEKLGLALIPEQLNRFQTYYEELISWNKRVNLTRITGYESVQIKHFLDSFTVILAFPSPPVNNLRVIDVGTGGGLPGLPVKILYPEISLCLLEATAKKTAFLNHVSQLLGLSGVDAITGRAEEIARQPDYREGFDIILARALAPLPVLLELTLPFCRVGGRLIAQKKGDITAETDHARYAIKQLGGKLKEIKKISLDEFPDGRQLVIIDKVSPTPEAYPRRPGTPAKRPLLSRSGEQPF